VLIMPTRRRSTYPRGMSHMAIVESSLVQNQRLTGDSDHRQGDLHSNAYSLAAQRPARATLRLCPHMTLRHAVLLCKTAWITIRHLKDVRYVVPLALVGGIPVVCTPRKCLVVLTMDVRSRAL
jgi:hypothetical protein